MTDRTVPMVFMPPAELPERCEIWRDQLGLSADRLIPPASTPVLLVLDMQNEFLTTEGQLPVWGGPAIIENVVMLIDAFRRNGFPVVFTRHICLEPYRHRETLHIMSQVDDPAGLLREGSFGAALHERIVPASRELAITKYRYSAFYDSPLDTVLRINGINEVVIAGVATNICCEATAHDAFFRGYRVLFTLDATGATSDSAHIATLSNIRLSYGEVVSTDQIIRALAGAGRKDESIDARSR